MGDGERETKYREYKQSLMISAFVRRTLCACSDYDLLHAEFNRIKQILVSSGRYANSEIDREINVLLRNHLNRHTKPKNESFCTVHYYERSAKRGASSL